MSIFLARWPNGDVSFVDAEDRDDAILVLDQLADPSDCQVEEIDGFQVDFRLNERGRLEFEGFSGEEIYEPLRRAFPVLSRLGEEWDAILPSTEPEDDGAYTPADEVRLFLAVLTERHRLAPEPPDPTLCLCCQKVSIDSEPRLCEQCLEEYRRASARVERLMFGDGEGTPHEGTVD